MLLSKQCEYGLASAMYLASVAQDGYVSIRTISERLGLSYPFLAKVLQRLNEVGMVVSRRGPSGGVALNRSPDGLTLKEIVVALDGAELFTECVLGLPGCGDEKPCPMHHQWGEVRGHLDALFGGMTLVEAAQQETEVLAEIQRHAERKRDLLL